VVGEGGQGGADDVHRRQPVRQHVVVRRPEHEPLEFLIRHGVALTVGEVLCQLGAVEGSERADAVTLAAHRQLERFDDLCDVFE
jgi:hypothetical protein